MPIFTPKPVKTSENARDMLRYDLNNENETIRNYRKRIRQCEAIGEFAMAEQIRDILVQEQDHQIVWLRLSLKRSQTLARQAARIDEAANWRAPCLKPIKGMRSA